MSAATVSRVARAVFKESVRDRVLYSLVAFAAIVIGASLLLGQLTAGQDVKIIKDLGLASMSVIGGFIAIFIGIGLVAKEVERRSVYSLLAKPVRRSELVVGKYLGLVLTLGVNVLFMTIVWYGVLAYYNLITPEMARGGWEGPATDPRMLIAVGLIFVQLMLVTAIAVFFSSFSTSPMLSALFTFGLFVAGHFSADLRNFESIVSSKALSTLARGLYYVLPNMAIFDVKSAVVHVRPIGFEYVISAVVYGLLYVLALLFASVLIFRRRDFK
jgi:ABC-type transport system involved in multi-copper enzyme maturation permease subunit